MMEAASTTCTVEISVKNTNKAVKRKMSYKTHHLVFSIPPPDTNQNNPQTSKRKAPTTPAKPQ